MNLKEQASPEHNGVGEEWTSRVQRLLQSNQVVVGDQRYTRPAPSVYEHQWLWDSCFQAITYRWFDPEMAAAELLSLLHHQVQEGAEAGMIPHMAYWRGGGESLWRSSHRSIITQPPLVGIAARLVYETTGNRGLLEQVYGPLEEFHAWFERRRDPDGDHLVSIIHPWESGWDASPRWDAPLGLVSPSPEESRQARITLVETLFQHHCRVEALERAGSFSVEALDFNAVRAADLEALSFIAHETGRPAEALAWAEQARLVQQAVQQKLIGSQPTDLAGAEETPLRHESASHFVALFGGCASPEQAEALIARIEALAPAVKYLVPTTPPWDPAFAPQSYWRGNVWISVNWLIYKGLQRYGSCGLAKEVVARSLALVDEHGFWEYFDPLTGKGCGSGLHSWSGLVLDMLKTA